MQGVGGIYELAGSSDVYAYGSGAYDLQISTGHPLRIDGCAVTWVGATGQTYHTGAWTVEFAGDCVGATLSLWCQYHGSMGGANRLVYDARCDA